MITTVRSRTVAGTRRARPDDALLDASGAAAAADLLAVASATPAQTLDRLGSGESGLSEIDVVVRLAEHGLNQLPAARTPTWTARLWTAVHSPFVLLLAGLDAIVAATGDPLGDWQER